MKLRYYLRGLGIGMLVTALVLGIAGGKDQGMSDEQIRVRAAQLGMVDASSTVLGNRQSGSPSGYSGMQPSSGSPENPEPSSAPESSTGEQAEGQTEPQSDEGTTGDDGTQPIAGTQPEESELGQDSSQPPEGSDQADVSVTMGGNRETVSFTINNGAGSDSVCRSLELAGLVESASVFDAYLNENSLTRRLRAGTFSIPVGASIEEIANIITGG